jgi:hypothetical protein
MELLKQYEGLARVKTVKDHLRFFRIPCIAAGTFIVRDLLGDISQHIAGVSLHDTFS